MSSDDGEPRARQRLDYSANRPNRPKWNVTKKQRSETTLGQAAATFRGRKGVVEVLDPAEDGDGIDGTVDIPETMLVKPRQSTIKLAPCAASTEGKSQKRVAKCTLAQPVISAVASVSQPLLRRRG